MDNVLLAAALMLLHLEPRTQALPDALRAASLAPIPVAMFAEPPHRAVEPGRAASGDPVSNGVAIGTVVGAGAALALMSGFYFSCSDCEKPTYKSMALPAVAVGAVAGAFVGYLVDRFR